MVQALYREWRPLTWTEIVGQEHVVRTLQNSVAAERLSHAYLFSGPRGTGKTSTARILAKAANCLSDDLDARPCNECEACVAVNEGRYLDLIEIDAASNTSVDDVRDLRDRINFAPNTGRYKVYIVDEVHMLSTAAFNALLKTLEEPPAHAIFILATTEVHRVPATVLSRCQRHEFRRIPVDEISEYLSAQITRGGYEVEPEALRLISRQATGSLRDAISLLDQLLSVGEAVTLDMAQEVLGTAVDEAVVELVQALVDGEAGRGLEIINDAVDGGIDPRQFARQIVEWLRSLLLISAGEPVDGREAAMAEQAELLGSNKILPAMRAFSQATRGERTVWQPGLALELAFMESLLTEGELEASGKGDPRDSAAQSGNEHKLKAQAGTASAAQADRTPDKPKSVSGSDNGPQALAPDNDQELEEATPTAGSESTPDVGAPEESEAGPSGEPPEIQPTLETAAPAAKASEVLPKSSPEFQRVLDIWPELLAAAYQRDPQTQALLNSCKPLGVDGSSLVLGFQSDLLREKMEKGHSQQIISESLAEVLEAEMDVRCVLIQDWGGDIDPAATPPLPEGGMVAAALRDLGAEVVDYEPGTDQIETPDPEEDVGPEQNLNEEER